MKRKIVLMLIIALLPMILSVSVAEAQVVPQTVNVYAWVDKRQYAPGETGTLYITVRNDDTKDYIIKNITIEYDPWFGYYKDAWEGNYTIKDEKGLPFSLLAGKIYNTEVTFTVPEGGRASSASITIRVWVDKLPWYFVGGVPVNVVNPPELIVITNMDVWMTSLTVVTVICTIILALAIFLATRRARVPRMVAPLPKAKAE